VCCFCCCCRMLSKLPHLAHLALLNPVAPDDIPNAPPEDLRSLLPALAMLVIDGAGAGAALNTLALWTRVRDQGVAPIVNRYEKCPVLVKRWSASWLQSGVMLGVHMLGFVLVDDDDVRALNAAAAGQCGFRQHYMALFLGEKVSLGALQQLQVSTLLHLRHELPDDVKGQVPEWTAPLPLTSQRFLALVRPDLDELNIENAGLLDDAALQDMASRAVELSYLKVENALQLGDALLWKLCGSCQQLRELTLLNAPKVTAAGVLPLLTVHTRLSLMVLQPARAVAGVELLAGLVACLRAVHPAVTDRWAVVQSYWQLSITRL
jgi:hypothetical protein